MPVLTGWGDDFIKMLIRSFILEQQQLSWDANPFIDATRVALINPKVDVIGWIWLRELPPKMLD